MKIEARENRIPAENSGVSDSNPNLIISQVEPQIIQSRIYTNTIFKPLLIQFLSLLSLLMLFRIHVPIFCKSERLMKTQKCKVVKAVFAIPLLRY